MHRWLAGLPCVALGLILILSECGGTPGALVESDPGAPLPGLTPGQLDLFREGRALFGRAFTPEEGLGPIFNQARCVSCHDLPESGGHGAEPVTKFSSFDLDTGCDLLAEFGGSLIQTQVVPAMREAGFRAEQVPGAAAAATIINPPALYGLGLVDAVAENEILARADPADLDGDGISGRPGLDADRRVARFGLKATHATLESFIEEAFRVEMGLTTPGHPHEELPNGRALPQEMDPVPEPEVGDAETALLAAYVRFLAPSAPSGPPDPAAESIFREIGCADCHTPAMVTGPNEVSALDRKVFRIYSDLLLHDMGPGLADICTPGSAPGEWRTAPLVGLGLRLGGQFLHNGKAPQFSEVILLHGGEAQASRDAFDRLTVPQKQRLMAFLATL